MSSNLSISDSQALADQPAASQARRIPACVGELDRLLAGPMWVVTIAWSAFLAVAIQDFRSDYDLSQGTEWYGWGLAITWGLITLEWLVHFLAGHVFLGYNSLFVLLPPLRLGGRDHATWSHVWLPYAGWRHVDRHLVKRVDKALSGPMIGFALLVLPVLLYESLWRDTAPRHPAIAYASDTASSVIWLAFLVELVVMVSIARGKLRYLAEHWIDLLIVLLPMVQAMPMLRLAYLGRLTSLSRLTRVYRTRGVAMRAFRAFLLLDSVQRLLHLNPAKRLEALEEKLQDHYHEIDLIREEMRELEERIQASERSSMQVEPVRGDAEGEC